MSSGWAPLAPTAAAAPEGEPPAAEDEDDRPVILDVAVLRRLLGNGDPH